MNQAEVKKKKKHLKVCQYSWRCFIIFFVKKETPTLWNCFCWGRDTHWYMTVFDMFIISIHYVLDWVQKRIYNESFPSSAVCFKKQIKIHKNFSLQHFVFIMCTFCWFCLAFTPVIKRLVTTCLIGILFIVIVRWLRNIIWHSNILNVLGHVLRQKTEIGFVCMSKGFSSRGKYLHMNG